MAKQQSPVQTRAWNLLQPSFRAVQCRVLWWWGGGGERVYVGQCVARPRLGCHHSVPSVWRDPGPGPLMTASCSHHQLGSQLASWAGEEQGSYRRAALYWSEVTTGPPLQVVSRARSSSQVTPHLTQQPGYRGRRSCCHHTAVRTPLQWHSDETTHQKWPQSSVNSDNISIFFCYMALPLKEFLKSLCFVLFCYWSSMHVGLCSCVKSSTSVYLMLCQCQRVWKVLPLAEDRACALQCARRPGEHGAHVCVRARRAQLPSNHQSVCARWKQWQWRAWQAASSTAATAQPRQLIFTPCLVVLSGQILSHTWWAVSRKLHPQMWGRWYQTRPTHLHT